MNIDVTLNLHYTAPKEIWDCLGELYRQMPGWAEAHGENGCPWPGQWFGGNGAPQWLTASVEPGGLQLYGELPEDVWAEWIDRFKRRAEEIVGYPVGAVEDGFPCRNYDDR